MSMLNVILQLERPYPEYIEKMEENVIRWQTINHCYIGVARNRHNGGLYYFDDKGGHGGGDVLVRLQKVLDRLYGA